MLVQEMERGSELWEALASNVWRELGRPDPPEDALQLAGDFGLRVVPGRAGGACLYGNTIEVDPAAREVRLHGLVAHELGHWVLKRNRLPDSEAGASYVGAALMLPRLPFGADVDATRWDLRRLRVKHLRCSSELIARRLVELRDAVATVWDNGRLKGRYCSPWIVHRLRAGGPTRFEDRLADLVIKSGETVRFSERVWGFPIFDGHWRRVITVVEAEQLGLRY